jgi:WD40 repeat protein
MSTALSISIRLIAYAVLAMPADAKSAENPTGNDSIVEPIGHQRVLELEKAVSARTSDGGWFTSVSWSSDGAEIAASGPSPETDIFRVSTLSVAKKLDGGPKGMAGGSQHSVAFSADGRLLVSGPLIATVWETASWQQKLQLIGPSRTAPQPFGIRSIVFSPDQQFVVVAYQSAGHPGVPVVAYRIADGSVAWTYHLKPTIGLPSIRTPLVISTARKEIAFGTREGTPDVGSDKRKLSRIVILDAVSGTMVRSIEDIHTDSPTALAISNDGQWFATATITGRIERTYSTEAHSAITLENKDPVRIWSVVSGARVKELAVHTEVSALAFSPDGRYLVGSVSESPGHSNLRIWNVDTGAVVQVLPTPREVGTAFGLAFSPDAGRLVAVGQGIAVLRYQPGH